MNRNQTVENQTMEGEPSAAALENHFLRKGKIRQVMGPVIDVEFEGQELPYMKEALYVDNH